MNLDKDKFLEDAVPFVKEYAATVSEFLMEDVREWAYGKGLEEPYDQRWWGNVSREAVKAGLMKKIGVAASGNPKGRYYRALWQSLIK